MKTTFIALTLILMSFAVLQGQVKINANKIEESQVPEAVKNAYQSAIGFPVKRWEKHEGSVKNKSGIKYVAIFESNMLPTRARYREDGTLISYSVYYKAAELPVNIKDAALKANPGMEIRRGEKIDVSKSQKTFYRIVLRKGTAQKSIFICDMEGNPIQKGKAPAEVNEAEDID